MSAEPPALSDDDRSVGSSPASTNRPSAPPSSPESQVSATSIGARGGTVAGSPPLSPGGGSVHSTSGAIPSTPNNNATRSNATPETPLTPLSGLEDNEGQEEDEDQNGNDNNNIGSDDDRSMEAPHGGRAGDPHGREEIDNDELQDDDATTTARGSDINIRTAASTFRSFLRSFRSLQSENNEEDSDSDDDSTMGLGRNREVSFYMAKLEAVLHRTIPSSLDIDTMHLYYHNQACQRLYHQLVTSPMEVIPIMDLVVEKELQQMIGDPSAPVPSVQVRPYNLKNVSNLRCLDPVAMDSLVCLKGMIVRASPIIPDLKVAHFSCVICGSDHQSRIDRGRIQEPHQCPQCNTKDSYQLVHNRSLFADKQLVRLQETPDQVPAGQTPASIVTFCYDDLVDANQPGDKVEVTGVLRAQPVRVNPKMTKLKSIYKTYVDIIHFRTITGMEREGTKGKKGVTTLTQERIQQLQELARQPDVYEQLTRSLAPSIWELDDVKKGVLCMLFGGNQRRVKNTEQNVVEQDSDEDDWSEDEEMGDRNSPEKAETKLHKRGDINILLCGDPGTSKSQLLSYVHKLSSRGVYTSGKGSSAVGLTASVVRDPETRDLVLESGALVLSDRGICCIDEFDKMTDATRSILHEVMEQQTVSIAKAGIIASLNARTSILASANPVESRYNPRMSVVENIKLPPTLLSRFDLIYLILDSPNADQDRRLAQHLVGLYYETPNVVQPPLDTELLKDYIDYARETIFPLLSEEATEQLMASYMELRNPPGGNVGNNGTRTISATPRQLESLIRTSEALAKMRYSSVVTRADAWEAVRLLKVATQAAATDPRTGRIDMDMINTGRSSADREMEENLYVGLKELMAERRGNRMAVRDVSRQLSEISNEAVPHEDVIGALRRLEADGVVQFNERAQTIFVRTGVVPS